MYFTFSIDSIFMHCPTFKKLLHCFTKDDIQTSKVFIKGEDEWFVPITCKPCLFQSKSRFKKINYMPMKDTHSIIKIF